VCVFVLCVAVLSINLGKDLTSFLFLWSDEKQKSKNVESNVSFYEAVDCIASVYMCDYLL
jgi:hypothetical protein